ncbi:putative U6 snRNA-associated protein [Clavispora lusitaniae]|uniref:LSM complex subunit LSM4 n=2 Tax=Clavispora lusitaniae TaxID=36911 RepID=A0AA91T498_CLALS|nr:LSM domain family protein [Clavispora lusitaniae]OVF11056.1 putative u6 snRNA complex subunit [Clavispora lusitaniae]QFZ28410.1 putative U6 snRNA-associated protein [Clavispora lusitaniae]QFZ34073.1 putative U6 snRNA-associated protein [Clavispora lusitaniae]QFZ39757.1 putative U6 snRNA-associated protein [Clavispora lusitaniae]
MLTSIKNEEILVELKNGETVIGKLSNCDSWMNLTLSNVVHNYNKGEKFNKIEEIYIRGSHIKYLRLPDSVMDHAKEQNMLNMEQRNRNQKRRGGFQRKNFNDGNRDNREGNRHFNSHSRGTNGRRTFD